MRMIFLLLLSTSTLLASFDEATQEIISAGMVLNQMRLCPATAGNFSRKIDEHLIAITVSGKHKGELTADDVIMIDYKGMPQETSKKPSAETLLHTVLYAIYPDIGAVLHTHSSNAIILSRLVDSQLITEGYEIHKIFDGIYTHESTLEFPVFENSQNYVTLSAQVTDYLKKHPTPHAILLRGHGVYVWGKTMKEALNRVEALENLFECEVKLRLINEQNR
jgi:methylthioribulose-1-phosphate dehydratase